VADRPFVLLSAAMSADGYLDDASASRLVLSSAADLDRVDELRAGCDAIMVGAQTIRADNPRLLVRSAARRERRRSRGLPASPRKVTVTRSGRLDPGALFFTKAEAPPLVYAPPLVCAPPLVDAPGSLAGGVAAVAQVIEIPPGAGTGLDWLLADLAGRGIGRLMVEGGASVLGQFLAAGLADEFWLAIAPVLVADPSAPRLLAGGPAGERLALAEVSQLGDMAVLKYLPPVRPAR
jgi:5-amino-6-(5-phosphoribosylamino)uracil reductase